MEKRQQSRAEVVVEVAARFDGRDVSGIRTRNISLGGAFLEAGNYPLPRRGSSVHLTFDDDNGAEGRRTLQARVTRVDDEGVALVFQEFDLDDFDFLQRLMD